MDNTQPDPLVGVIKALADPTRLRIIVLLHQQGELAVVDICLRLQLPRSNTSDKLIKMTRLNLVRPRRHGARVYYSLVDAPAGWAELLHQLAHLR